MACEQKKTPKRSDLTGRFEYLQALVNEFQTTQKKGMHSMDRVLDAIHYNFFLLVLLNKVSLNLPYFLNSGLPTSAVTGMLTLFLLANSYLVVIAKFERKS